MIKFGWFEADVNEAAVDIENGTTLPLLWQRTQTRETNNRTTPQFEGFLPLENKLFVWLFGELDHGGYWEVHVNLWVPCPIHPRNPDSRNCQYPAQRCGETVVTNPRNCSGAMCENCGHERVALSIQSDPGDVSEFYEVLADWSRYTFEPQPVAPHDDHYLWCVEHNIPA